jgi:hypothetical protein
MLVPSVSMAQSEEQAPPEESKQGAEEAQAQDSDSKTGEPRKELKNGLLLGFSHAFRLIRDRGSATASESRNTEQLYGFLVGYERVLHRYLALSIIKPFYFNHERVDSPLEIVLLGIYRKNSWEPFLGAGVISTIGRVTEEEGGEEVQTVEFSVGLLFVVGFKYFFTPKWAFEFEFGYEFVPKSTTTVEHQFATSYQGAYFFQ